MFEPDVHDGPDKIGMCPAVAGSIHDLHNMDIHLIIGSNNDIVKQVPVLGARVCPGCLVFATVSEDGVHNGKPVLCTFA